MRGDPGTRAFLMERICWQGVSIDGQKKAAGLVKARFVDKAGATK